MYKRGRTLIVSQDVVVRSKETFDNVKMVLPDSLRSTWDQLLSAVTVVYINYLLHEHALFSFCLWISANTYPGRNTKMSLLGSW